MEDSILFLPAIWRKIMKSEIYASDLMDCNLLMKWICLILDKCMLIDKAHSVLDVLDFGCYGNPWLSPPVNFRELMISKTGNDR